MEDSIEVEMRQTLFEWERPYRVKESRINNNYDFYESNKLVGRYCSTIRKLIAWGDFGIMNLSGLDDKILMVDHIVYPHPRIEVILVEDVTIDEAGVILCKLLLEKT